MKRVIPTIIKAVILNFVLMLSLSISIPVFAQGVDGATFKGVCERVENPADGDKFFAAYPPCANSPADCATQEIVDGEPHEPLNCLYLEEPIGGDPGYDLYKVSCLEDPTLPDGPLLCRYILWHGEAIVGHDRGPIQAILAYEPGKEHEAALGPLMGYLSLVYNFLSGVIVSFVILIVIIGGIRMTTSNGNSEQFGKGKDMITKAIVGMALWFLASLILYTINPLFFNF